MNRIEDQDPYSQAPLWKVTARTVLYALHRVLPRKVYHAMYFPAYGAYQWSLRWAYRRKLERARKTGCTKTIARMERVYSVMPHSLIGASGLEHTHDRALEVVENDVSGCFVECGVAAGGCAALIAQVANAASPQRECWFFDSYEGLPDPTSDDFEAGATGQHIRPLPRGSCLGTYEQVSKLLFEKMKLPSRQIHLVKGWFEDTLPKTKDQIGPIALLRIDGDWYNSTMCCFENLYDLVTPGGSVIVDDYFSCHGAQKATNEFLSKHDIRSELVSDGRGGCSFIKPRETGQQSANSTKAA